MKTVVAALAKKDDKYLIAKRKPEGPLGDKCEFPGGKIEADETDAQDVEREIITESNTLVEVGELLATATIDKNTIYKLYACTHKLGGLSR